MDEARNRAVMLFSGGLDSRLALKLVLRQAVELHALHFTSLFSASQGSGRSAGGGAGADFARECGVAVTLEDITEELMGLVADPPHGRGSGVNPCIDCRIMQLRRARAVMERVGGRFVVTGEVLGQRPMSQRRDAMRVIERAAGLEGLVVRPLCARSLEPSIPEREGWVDRRKLLDITGRGRKPQMALAQELGIIDYPAPAGGCRLTEPGYAARMRDLMAHEGLSVADAGLLKVGRHLRLGPRTRLVVGRDEAENARIEALAQPGDCLLDAEAFPGPTSLVRGAWDADALRLAARITARYGKGHAEAQVVVIVRGAAPQRLTVAPATEADIAPLRI